MSSNDDIDDGTEDNEEEKIEPLNPTENLSGEEANDPIDESIVFPIKDLPSTVQRMILKMLPKKSRDSYRLVSRWFSETVVKLDASYRNIRLCLDYGNLPEPLSNIKVKDSYMQNTLKIHIVLSNNNFFDDETLASTASQIYNDWKENVYKLSISLGEHSQLLSATNVFFKNLEYLQIKNTFIPKNSSLVTEDLINRHKETIKNLRIFKMPGLELDCKKFSVLTRLSVEGIDMISMGAILRLCCESLVHLDIDICSAPPVSQQTIIDCQFSRLKYVSLSGDMNDLYVNILNLSASHLLGLKILSREFKGDLKVVDLPVLKFLYLNDYTALPKSCPRLEFLKVGFYAEDAGRFDSPKLNNLKALIVPYNDKWATHVMKSCKESLQFVHVTSKISGAIEVDDKIMTLPPNSHDDLLKQWLVNYIKRNPLYNRMLKRVKTSDYESDYENFHTFISSDDSDQESFDPDDYDYDSDYDDIWDHDHDVEDIDQDFGSDDYDNEGGDFHGDIDDYDVYGDGFEYFDHDDYDLDSDDGLPVVEVNLDGVIQAEHNNEQNVVVDEQGENNEPNINADAPADVDDDVPADIHLEDNNSHNEEDIDHDILDYDHDDDIDQDIIDDDDYDGDDMLLDMLDHINVEDFDDHDHYDDFM